MNEIWKIIQKWTILDVYTILQFNYISYINKWIIIKKSYQNEINT